MICQGIILSSLWNIQCIIKRDWKCYNAALNIYTLTPKTYLSGSSFLKMSTERLSREQAFPVPAIKNTFELTLPDFRGQAKNLEEHYKISYLVPSILKAIYQYHCQSNPKSLLWNNNCPGSQREGSPGDMAKFPSLNYWSQNSAQNPRPLEKCAYKNRHSNSMLHDLQMILLLSKSAFGAYKPKQRTEFSTTTKLTTDGRVHLT